ncbi:hypothetical protein [Hymenobacter glacieicola]|uniref:Uncharacterized protein n=1 Tax=Hymenobacter glacieicola TaxID=1562124 RepID=A0ABQ1X0H4_9BACT|nr:hypothetical protein [Hymenobacter glacieicola]GGG50051.1 hypothetical protein GCM10011378_27700 [Hymenobacter glacieicola]
MREGVSGSFNPAGFTLHSARYGRPVFRPAGVTGAGDEKWLNGFEFPNAEELIHAVAVSGSSVYVAGNFRSVGGVAASNVARWDGATWNPVGQGTNGPVNTLVFSCPTLYAGGAFTEAGGGSASRGSFTQLGNGSKPDSYVAVYLLNPVVTNTRVARAPLGLYPTWPTKELPFC